MASTVATSSGVKKYQPSGIDRPGRFAGEGLPGQAAGDAQRLGVPGEGQDGKRRSRCQKIAAAWLLPARHGAPSLASSRDLSSKAAARKAPLSVFFTNGRARGKGAWSLRAHHFEGRGTFRQGEWSAGHVARRCRELARKTGGAKRILLASLRYFNKGTSVFRRSRQCAGDRLPYRKAPPHPPGACP